jgi:glycosyltransferase involved in cell wall biosynthesis
MKIAWFTPFRKVSAIGRFSRLVTDSLAREAQVDLWLADPDSEELHGTALRIIRYPQLPNVERRLGEYDVVVYNLGDHGPFHGQIYEVAQRVPGVVILHDYVMHHFFATYYAERQAWDKYADVLRRWYGLDLKMTASGWTGRDREIVHTRDGEGVIHYPLFEEAIVGSLGVITHADFVREAVARVAAAPVAKIPLAYSVDCASPVLSRRELQIAEDRVLVVTVGHANENKRIHVVLQAIAANRDLADSIAYVVVGGCDGPFAQKLQALREDWKLRDAVRFTGYASDEVLRSFLMHAGLCVNLRWPAMEGGSASCAEQMLFGKPAIVTDTGVYSELPDNCVRKVRPEHELDDLTRHLRELVTDANLRKSMGEQARRYAEENFSPDVYARRFLGFCADLAYYQPALSLMDDAGRELRRMGATSDMAIVDTVAREGALLTEGDYDPPILRKENYAGPSEPAGVF